MPGAIVNDAIAGGAARKGGPSASRNMPTMPPCVVDHDFDTVTFAVTFRWARPWALDHCEVGVICGELRRAIVAHFSADDYDQLHSLDAVQTWEPNEERHIGKPGTLSVEYFAGGIRLAQERGAPS